MSKETCGLLLLAVGGIAFLIYTVMMGRHLGPALTFGSRPAAGSVQRRHLVEEVRSSGMCLANIACAGQIGGLYVRGPLMTVEIYPAGIVISPIISASAVKLDQIKELKYEQAWWGRSLRIRHTSQAIGNPIVLQGIKEDSSFASILNSLVGSERLRLTGAK